MPKYKFHQCKNCCHKFDCHLPLENPNIFCRCNQQIMNKENRYIKELEVVYFCSDECLHEYYYDDTLDDDYDCCPYLK